MPLLPSAFGWNTIVVDLQLCNALGSVYRPGLKYATALPATPQAVGITPVGTVPSWLAAGSE